MEIKDIKPTAEAKFKIIDLDGSEKEATFIVGFIGPHTVLDYTRPGEPESFRLSKIIQGALVEAVEGWDLTIGGKPVPCTIENKRKYFPRIMGAKLAGRKKDVAFEAFLGGALANFAGDEENFLKN